MLNNANDGLEEMVRKSTGTNSTRRTIHNRKSTEKKLELEIDLKALEK